MAGQAAIGLVASCADTVLSLIHIYALSVDLALVFAVDGIQEARLAECPDVLAAAPFAVQDKEVLAQAGHKNRGLAFGREAVNIPSLKGVDKAAGAVHALVDQGALGVCHGRFCRHAEVTQVKG